MHTLKCKLENAAFRVLFPRQHERIIYLLDEEEQNLGMQTVLDATYCDIKRALMEDEVFMEEIGSFKIKARIKEPFSLWKKMLKSNTRKVRKEGEKNDSERNSNANSSRLPLPSQSDLRSPRRHCITHNPRSS